MENVQKHKIILQGVLQVSPTLKIWATIFDRDNDRENKTTTFEHILTK